MKAADTARARPAGLTFLEAWRLRAKVAPEGGPLLPWLLGIAQHRGSGGVNIHPGRGSVFRRRRQSSNAALTPSRPASSATATRPEAGVNDASSAPIRTLPAKPG